jgi:hypothetical protein
MFISVVSLDLSQKASLTACHLQFGAFEDRDHVILILEYAAKVSFRAVHFPLHFSVVVVGVEYCMCKPASANAALHLQP